jgi:hypothetical protein|tara:strand:+ start:399 stop:1403 length:1005 start_codon:yes stop_codon:yes gene_type:complete
MGTNLNKKYVIGTHVMWFEIEMYADFIDGMVNLLETVENKENVTIDLCFNMLQHFEKVDTDKIKKHELLIKFKKGVATLEDMGYIVNQHIKDGDEFYFHADYRRDLNYNYCKKVDYVMWGETDSFFPKEAFQAIETLAKYTDEQGIHKYLLSFADRKMWDSSWDSLVHVDYRDVKFIDDDNGHLYTNQAKSQLPIEEMNKINAKADEFDFGMIKQPKISGACLVLSADLIKFGVNIPSCLLYNDDEGLSIMCQKLLGQDFMQFICQNILHVHARRHSQKRLYVKNEDNPHSFIGEKNNDFQEFLKLSKENINKLITGQGKFKEYQDLKNILENK